MAHVTTFGPGGYHHQYVVTAWLTLAWAEPSIEVLVDPPGREDALFKYPKKCQLEVQVKSSSDDVDVRYLANLVAHVYGDSSCLLRYLQENEDSIAVFILGGRCLDDVAPLCVGTGQMPVPRQSSPISRQTARAVQSELLAISERHEADGNSTLAVLLHDLASNPFVQNFQRLSRRIFVLERCDLDFVADQFRRTLSIRYRVPPSVCGRATGSLAEVVRNHRGQTANLAPALTAALRVYQCEHVFVDNPSLFVSRPELESQLLDTLTSRQVLLLTGPARCGKSWLARHVAQQYQENGAHALVGSDVDDARRHLLSLADAEDRLYLLEDPFGSNVLHSAARLADAVSGAEGLAETLPPGRYLIVTSRRDILNQAFGAGDSEDIALRNYRWESVSRLPDEFCVGVWRTHASDLGLSREVISRVEDLIREGHHLQPGQLRHLAGHSGLDQLSDEALLRLARQIDVDIGRELVRDEPMRHLLQVLRSVTGTRKPVSSTVLNSVIRDVAEPIAPDSEDGSRLDHLEQRGFVVATEDGYRFSHPGDLVIAEAAFEGLQRNGFRGAVRRLNRALKCDDGGAASNAISLVAELRARQTDLARKKMLIELESQGLKSPYPEVSDKALVGLLSLDSDTLDPPTTEAITGAILAGGVFGRQICWTETGQAQFEEVQRPRSALNKGPKKSTRRSAAELAAMSDREVWREVVESGHVCEELAKRALTCNLAQVRSLAAAYFLWRGPDRELSLAETFLSDRHPVVFIRAIQGLMLGWRSRGPTSRQRLLRLALQALSSVGHALLFSRLIPGFSNLAGWDHEWYEGRTFPWDPAVTLVTATLKAIPVNHPVPETAIWNFVCKSYKQEFPPSEMMPLLEAWLDRTEAQLQSRIYNPDAYDVARLVLDVARDEPQLRSALMLRLLKSNDTEFLCHTVDAMVRRWESLTEDEKGTLLETLTSDRSDSNELIASALAARVPPVELRKGLTLSSDVPTTAAEVISAWPDQVIDRCLRLFTGYGVPEAVTLSLPDNEMRELWLDVIRNVVRTPHHPAFECALYALQLVGLESEESQSIWAELCERTDGFLEDVLGQCLLAWLARIPDLPVSAYWKPFASRQRSANDLERWVDLLEAHVSDVEFYRNERVLLQGDELAKAVIHRFPPDLEILELALLNEDDEFAAGELLQLCHEQPPQLQLTYNILKKRLPKNVDELYQIHRAQFLRPAETQQTLHLRAAQLLPEFKW